MVSVAIDHHATAGEILKAPAAYHPTLAPALFPLCWHRARKSFGSKCSFRRNSNTCGTIVLQAERSQHAYISLHGGGEGLVDTDGGICIFLADGGGSSERLGWVIWASSNGPLRVGRPLGGGIGFLLQRLQPIGPLGALLLLSTSGLFNEY